MKRTGTAFAFAAVLIALRGVVSAQYYTTYTRQTSDLTNSIVSGAVNPWVARLLLPRVFPPISANSSGNL